MKENLEWRKVRQDSFQRTKKLSGFPWDLREQIKILLILGQESKTQ